MEYENCHRAEGGLSAPIAIAIAILLVLILFMWSSRSKQRVVGIRDGNWVNGVYVSPRR